MDMKASKKTSSTSTSRAKSTQQNAQLSLAETAVHRVPSEEDDQLCEVSPNQDEEVFSPLQAQSPVEADSFESDTGNPHPSSLPLRISPLIHRW